MIYRFAQLRCLLVERKSAGKLSFKKRHSGSFKLTPNDQVKVAWVEKSMKLLTMLKFIKPKLAKSVDKLVHVMLAQHLALKYIVITHKKFTKQTRTLRKGLYELSAGWETQNKIAKDFGREWSF